MSAAPSPPDPHSLAALQARYGARRYRWLLLGTLMVCVIASIMSSTIVNVAVPDLSHHFALGQDRAQWVASGFMAASTAAMLTTPWLLHRFGYRHTYLACALLLLAGGLLGGLAPSFGLVLAARVLEGIAAGVVQPLPAIVIMRAFEPGERGRASGLFGMGVLLAPALGPSVGGVLVDLFGWRSIFFMVVPFCAVSLVLAFRLVPTTAPGGVPADEDARLDWPGLLLAIAGTGLLLNGLVALSSAPGTQALALFGGAALAAAALVAWLLRQQRRPDAKAPPLIDLALFANRPFAMGSVVSAVYGVALFGSTYLLPLYLQEGMRLSASWVGTLMLPSGLALAVIIVFTGRMADRHAVHLMLAAGFVMMAASFAAMAGFGPGSPLAAVIAVTILGRVGLGFVLPSLNNGALRELQHVLVSQGASTINFIRMLGGAAGVSLCGVFLQWRMTRLGTALGDVPPEQALARLRAFHETFVLLALLCVLSMLAAWRMRPAPAS